MVLMVPLCLLWLLDLVNSVGLVTVVCLRVCACFSLSLSLSRVVVVAAVVDVMRVRCAFVPAVRKILGPFEFVTVHRVNFNLFFFRRKSITIKVYIHYN